MSSPNKVIGYEKVGPRVFAKYANNRRAITTKTRVIEHIQRVSPNARQSLLRNTDNDLKRELNLLKNDDIRKKYSKVVKGLYDLPNMRARAKQFNIPNALSMTNKQIDEEIKKRIKVFQDEKKRENFYGQIMDIKAGKAGSRNRPRKRTLSAGALRHVQSKNEIRKSATSVKSLRALAKRHGVKRYSVMNKQQLLRSTRPYQSPKKISPIKNPRSAAQLNNLPTELKMKIMLDMPPDKLQHLCKTNKAFYRICNDPYFKKRYYEKLANLPRKLKTNYLLYMSLVDLLNFCKSKDFQSICSDPSFQAKYRKKNAITPWMLYQLVGSGQIDSGITRSMVDQMIDVVDIKDMKYQAFQYMRVNGESYVRTFQLSPYMETGPMKKVKVSFSNSNMYINGHLVMKYDKFEELKPFILTKK